MDAKPNTPCPFCACTGGVVVELDHGEWMVECPVCHSTGPIAYSDAAAALAWQARGAGSAFPRCRCPPRS